MNSLFLFLMIINGLEGLLLVALGGDPAVNIIGIVVTGFGWLATIETH